MWNLKDSNKIIGTQMKIDSFKRHLLSMQNIKPRIKMQTPWRPSFSLSKNKNKYQKISQTSISRENQSLLKRMIQIESQPMMTTVNIVPQTRPSNKHTHSLFKSRQRQVYQSGIYLENEKIFDKIETAMSTYKKERFDTDWKENKRYKNNLRRKEYVPDYNHLARSTILQSRLRTRPATALPR